MTDIDPVTDWAGDYDIFDPRYIEDPYTIWSDLRGSCPIAHTDRRQSTWLPTRYDDVVAFARMVPALSSDEVTVVPLAGQISSDDPTYGVKAPPITSDPPEHTWARRLLLPYFSPQATEKHRPYTEALCHQLIDAWGDRGQVDGAVEYAQQIPPRVIAHLLGIDESRSAEFTEWVRGVLELGLTNTEVRLANREKLLGFMLEQIADRRANPGDDFISYLLHQDVDGEPVPELHVLGTLNLMLIAGIDTTWSSIGSAVWHLAQHPDDAQRLREEPELIPNAVEELLRAYSPVTMARVVTEEVTHGDITMCPGDRVLMNFPGANRDPEMFEDPDTVIIDRARNRHVAFGVGIHRCAGSNLARMEMQVSIKVLLERISELSLADADAVTWAGGQVRGPRRLPLSIVR